MANRIEPFRDYSEHEVVNLFSLDVDGGDDLKTWKPGNSSAAKYDQGVVVSAKLAALPGDLPSSTALKTSGALRDYLGASGQPHMGYNAYPICEMSMEPAAAGVLPLGLTLKQTLAYDENDENLLRYPLKKDELQAVLPGHAVPVLTRGLVLMSASAFSADVPVVGGKVSVITGGLGLLDDGTAGSVDVGKCIAIGEATDTSAKKYLCKLSF
jgi:hypothetical protein